MLPILLAGASALIWGTGDFCGGKAVQLQRGHALSVTVFSQLSAVPMIALFLLVVPGQVGVSAMVWGGVAGVAGLFGIGLLYHSLAGGAMAVVAPTTAVTAAVVPLIGGLLQGERPGAMPITGALCAIVAIGLVSLGPSGSGGPRTTSPRVFGTALLAGVMFGLFFLLLARAGDGAGMWPLAAARFAALPVGLLLLRFSPLGGPLLLRGRVAAFAAVAGVLDITANGFYLLAVYDGNVSVLAPVASLYPASTVLLALIVDKERLRPIQFAGLGLAAASLVLVAA